MHVCSSSSPPPTGPSLLEPLCESQVKLVLKITRLVGVKCINKRMVSRTALEFRILLMYIGFRSWLEPCSFFSSCTTSSDTGRIKWNARSWDNSSWVHKMFPSGTCKVTYCGDTASSAHCADWRRFWLPKEKHKTKKEVVPLGPEPTTVGLLDTRSTNWAMLKRRFVAFECMDLLMRNWVLLLQYRNPVVCRLHELLPKVALGAVEWKQKPSRLRSGRCMRYPQIWPKPTEGCFCAFCKKYNANQSCAVHNDWNILSNFPALFYA